MNFLKILVVSQKSALLLGTFRDLFCRSHWAKEHPVDPAYFLFVVLQSEFNVAPGGFGGLAGLDPLLVRRASCGPALAAHEKRFGGLLLEFC
jgi:hypothetical protein